MELAGHAPLGVTNQAGIRTPLLRLDGMRWALRSVALIIHLLPTPFLGEEGADAGNLPLVQPQQPGYPPSS